MKQTNIQEEEVTLVIELLVISQIYLLYITHKRTKFYKLWI